MYINYVGQSLELTKLMLIGWDVYSCKEACTNIIKPMIVLESITNLCRLCRDALMTLSDKSNVHNLFRPLQLVRGKGYDFYQYDYTAMR
jgi:hypothetical protein